MAWKYIMFKIGDRLVPVIFPDFMVHNEVAHGMRRAHPPLRAASIESAGSIDGITPLNVHGQSETLRLHAMPERDTRVIRQFQYAHGLNAEVRVEARTNPIVGQQLRERANGTPRLSREDRRFLRLTHGTGHGRDHGRE